MVLHLLGFPIKKSTVSRHIVSHTPLTVRPSTNQSPTVSISFITTPDVHLSVLCVLPLYRAFLDELFSIPSVMSSRMLYHPSPSTTWDAHSSSKIVTYVRLSAISGGGPRRE